MTARDDTIELIHDQIVSMGVATEVNDAIRVRLLRGMLNRLISGQPKWIIVQWLNMEAGRLGKDVRPIAVDVFNTIKDVDL